MPPSILCLPLCSSCFSLIWLKQRLDCLFLWSEVLWRRRTRLNLGSWCYRSEVQVYDLASFFLICYLRQSSHSRQEAQAATGNQAPGSLFSHPHNNKRNSHMLQCIYVQQENINQNVRKSALRHEKRAVFRKWALHFLRWQNGTGCFTQNKMFRCSVLISIHANFL